MELGVNMVWDMEKNDWSGTDVVFCKYFFPKVASCFSPLLHVDFPQYCKSRFPHHLRCENHDIAGKNN